MVRALGFNQGQIGDLAMQVVLCKHFKKMHPDSHMTFGINKKYEKFVKNASFMPNLEMRRPIAAAPKRDQASPSFH